MTTGDFARAVLSRLKHTVLTFVALVVIVTAEYFLFFAFILLTGLAFLGSTGRAHEQFISPLVPFAYFAVGAAINPAVGLWLAGLPTPVLQKIKDLSEASEKREQASVLEFVKGQKAVAEAVGDNFTVANSGISGVQDGRVIRYEITVSAKKRAYAIVNVSRSSGRTEFSLACVTPLDYAHRPSGRDPCAQ